MNCTETMLYVEHQSHSGVLYSYIHDNLVFYSTVLNETANMQNISGSDVVKHETMYRKLREVSTVGTAARHFNHIDLGHCL